MVLLLVSVEQPSPTQISLVSFLIVNYSVQSCSCLLLRAIRENPITMLQTIPRGRRLLPQILDQTAQQQPESVYAEVPHTDWRKDGWRNVTYSQVARAVNALSWWLDENLSQKVRFETFLYMGPSDLRYALVSLAAMKTRRTVSLMRRGSFRSMFDICVQHVW